MTNSIKTYIGPQLVVENGTTTLASLQLTSNGVLEVVGPHPSITSSTTGFKITNVDNTAQLDLETAAASLYSAGDINLVSTNGTYSLTITTTSPGYGTININGNPGTVGQVLTAGGLGFGGVYFPTNWQTPNYNNPQTANLVGGTVAVADITVTASTTVLVTVQTPGGTQGFLSVAVTAGVGFVINSTSATETSTVAYMRVG